MIRVTLSAMIATALVSLAPPLPAADDAPLFGRPAHDGGVYYVDVRPGSFFSHTSWVYDSWPYDHVPYPLTVLERSLVRVTVNNLTQGGERVCLGHSRRGKRNWRCAAPNESLVLEAVLDPGEYFGGEVFGLGVTWGVGLDFEIVVEGFAPPQ